MILEDTRYMQERLYSSLEGGEVYDCGMSGVLVVVLMQSRRDAMGRRDRGVVEKKARPLRINLAESYHD